MNNIEFRKPNRDEIPQLNQFFQVSITDTFAKEGLSHLLSDIENEIRYKEKILKIYFENNDGNRCFFIAVNQNEIIGTIEYSPINGLIKETVGVSEGIEVGTVFVHPDYQRQGIGNKLLSTMFKKLYEDGITEFYLDSGYKNAQKIWLRKFGAPQYILKHYWSEGSDHMIWKLKTTDLLK